MSLNAFYLPQNAHILNIPEGGEGFVSGGPCLRCGVWHALPVQPALPAAAKLLRMLIECRSLEFLDRGNLRLRLEPLFTPGCGQMFGVLTGYDRQGCFVERRAFSGQFFGVWNVVGWAPPLVDSAVFREIAKEDANRIARLTASINTEGKTSRAALWKKQRRRLSRALMERLFDCYTVHNFAGEIRPLRQAFAGSGMPTGTGECCAPKLLQQAILEGIRPVGLVEFFVGGSNRSGTRQHGHIYPPCAEKCTPLLGYMLCGCNTCR